MSWQPRPLCTGSDCPGWQLLEGERVDYVAVACDCGVYDSDREAEDAAHEAGVFDPVEVE